MTVIDELPFRFVENVRFRLMMFVCCPALNMPSRISIARDIYHLYVDERVKFKRVFYTCMSKGTCNSR